MKPVSLVHQSVLTLALLGCAVSSPALTLGRVRGAAMLGQSLELTVAVQLEPEEGANTQCFDADVFYGEVRQDPGRVSAALETAPEGTMATLRIRSIARVDEPVVSVLVRAGCAQKSIRRYVLLADLASEVLSPPALVMAPTVPAKTVDAGKEVLPAGGGAVPRATEAAKPHPASRAPVLPRPAAVTDRKPRLRLATLDLTERDPALKWSPELLTVPGDDPEVRAHAVALWRSLNVSAQDVVREAARVQLLESDFVRLRAQTSKNLAALQDLEVRLERSESQRYANPLVFTLMVLLSVCSAALVWMWLRMRAAGPSHAPWWRGSALIRDGSVGPMEDLPEDPVEVSVVRSASPDATATRPNEVPVEIDVDLDIGESVFARLDRKPALVEQKAVPVHTSFSHGGSGLLETAGGTAPAPEVQTGDFGVDLDLSVPGQNLIDFEVSGFSRMPVISDSNRKA